MKIIEPDLQAYLRTQDLPGGPIHDVVEVEYCEFQPFTDDEGNPTRGGMIGYTLGYAVMICFVATMFYVL